MELRNSTVLLLGGSGLVGMAVARRLIDFAPRQIVVSGLTREEVVAALRELEAVAGDITIEGVW
jgi:uncharacterized protein YbjT (DUF2867 family)